MFEEGVRKFIGSSGGHENLLDRVGSGRESLLVRRIDFWAKTAFLHCVVSCLGSSENRVGVR